MNSNDEKTKFTEATQVDLGEDLLDGPAQTPDTAIKDLNTKKAEIENPFTTENEQTLFEKAQILLNEKLIDEAKKKFRAILRKNPLHDEAKKKLDEIQKIEIQALLSSEESGKKLGQKEPSLQEDLAAVYERLEEVLDTKLLDIDLKPIPNLFKDLEAHKEYSRNILKLVLKLTPKDRMDVGVAFYEMGLYDLAVEIFQTVVRYEDYKIPGIYLLGLALIKAGKAIEATIRIEPFARDLTISESQKTDLLYLMGMAFEQMCDKVKSREFYRRVSLLNPKYKDVQEKLKKS